MRLLFKTPLNISMEKVRDGFTQDLFTFLAPPFIPFQLQRFDGCKKNNEVHLSLGIWPFRQKWVSLITEEGINQSGWYFVDEGKLLPWPLTSWKHVHRVDQISAQESVIVDDINYECSGQVLSFLIKPFLWWVFSHRPRRYQLYFRSQS